MILCLVMSNVWGSSCFGQGKHGSSARAFGGRYAPDAKPVWRDAWRKRGCVRETWPGRNKAMKDCVTWDGKQKLVSQLRGWPIGKTNAPSLTYDVLVRTQKCIHEREPWKKRKMKQGDQLETLYKQITHVRVLVKLAGLGHKAAAG